MAYAVSTDVRLVISFSWALDSETCAARSSLRMASCWLSRFRVSRANEAELLDVAPGGFEVLLGPEDADVRLGHGQLEVDRGPGLDGPLGVELVLRRFDRPEQLAAGVDRERGVGQRDRQEVLVRAEDEDPGVQAQGRRRPAAGRPVDPSRPPVVPVVPPVVPSRARPLTGAALVVGEAARAEAMLYDRMVTYRADCAALTVKPAATDASFWACNPLVDRQRDVPGLRRFSPRADDATSAAVVVTRPAGGVAAPGACPWDH